MATFILTYRVPRQPLSEAFAGLDERARAARLEAWSTWLDSLQGHVVDAGKPVEEARVLGDFDTETRLGGYSLISAEGFDEAVALAAGCPVLTLGGGVEIGALAEVPGLRQPSPAGAERATA